MFFPQRSQARDNGICHLVWGLSATYPGAPLNRYAYGLNNPVQYNDPSGRAFSECGPDGNERGDLKEAVSSTVISRQE